MSPCRWMRTVVRSGLCGALLVDLAGSPPPPVAAPDWKVVEQTARGSLAPSTRSASPERT